MKIAFWNINRKELSDLIVEFVNEQQIDVLILAESTEQTILDFIKKQSKYNPSRKFNIIAQSKVDLLSVYDHKIFDINEDFINSKRWTYAKITIPGIIVFNLFCIHFHSKVNWSTDSQSLECVNLSRDIALVEEGTGIDETILIGDFNMNPYESGMVAANGLHALPDLDHIKDRKARVIDGVRYKYFYNPMWSFFGDSVKPYGTFYYREPGHVSQEWNIFDQVIYRPLLSKSIK
ncbi:MAG: hypothetical protein AAF696_17025, partial [Bacteroidota bacterium]